MHFGDCLGTPSGAAVWHSDVFSIGQLLNIPGEGKDAVPRMYLPDQDHGEARLFKVSGSQGRHEQENAFTLKQRIHFQRPSDGKG